MAQQPRRRPRGTGVGRVAVFAEVDPGTKQKLDDMVAATGEPKGVLLEALIARADVDADGRPVWWSAAPVQQEVFEMTG